MKHRLLRAVVLASGCALAGCGWRSVIPTGSPGGTFQVQSPAAGTRLAVDARTAVYTPIDENSADLYLSDLSFAELEQLATGAAESEAAGTLLRMHVFLQPRAGRTPIAFSASNATFDLVVFADGLASVGIYGGGGFVLPDGDLGADRVSGRTQGATLRYLGGSPRFDDQLGRAVVDGNMTVEADPERAALLGRLVAAIQREYASAP